VKKVLVWTVALAAGIVVAAWAAVELRWRRTFDAPFPAIVESHDPAALERGRYLVYGPATCAYCHVPREQWSTLEKGAELPLTGDHVFRLPFGEFLSPNLTPDASTGIGARSPGQLARVLRYGVRADGRAAFPLMAFHEMSDDDLADVIAFLRSRPAVAHAVPDHRLTLLGKTLMAFAIGPVGPSAAPRATSPKGLSIERGEYLANDVASCVECHTDRGGDGQFVGPKFAGGQKMDLALDKDRIAVPPNLTPDPSTSPIGRWDEGMFVTRFRAGEVIRGTPMPWGAYAHMTEDDVRSIYRYLKTLPPTVNHTGPPMQKRARE